MLDLDRFVTECRAALREGTPELAVKAVLERAVSDPGAVEQALGVPRQAEIVTLHHSPELTVLNVLWAPGMAIYPHDHRMWAIIGLYGGREDNTFYRRTGEGLTVTGGKQLERSDVAVLGRNVIHAVSNPSRRVTGAIHVYGGDFFGTPRSEWDPETLQERPYDMERARRVFAEANARWAAEAKAG